MSTTHTNDTKLVHVDCMYGGYHPNTGGRGYTLAGFDMLKAKFIGKTRQPKHLDATHAKTRKANVPQRAAKSEIEGVPAKPGIDNPKVSMDVQKLPPANENSVGEHVVL